MFPASPIAETRPKVLVIAGSTGTGKSRLAVELAKQFDGEVVSGDSMQVYRGMDIGTAKITPDEMQGIPHHLLDVRDPGQSYDVRQFQQLARASIRDILNRGHLPILCGGTGLYLKAALYDYEFEEQPEDPVLKAQLESMTNEELHTRLKREDPESAGKIHPNNRKRVIRALMIASSGKTKSGREKEQAHAPLFDVFWLGLENRTMMHGSWAGSGIWLPPVWSRKSADCLPIQPHGLPQPFRESATRNGDRTLKDSVPGMRSWSRFIYTPGNMPDDREPGSRIRCPCAGMIRWIQKR